MTWHINVERQEKIEQEMEQRRLDEEARLKALRPPTPVSSSTEESEIDEDFLERRKQKFDVIENIKKRSGKNKNSLLDNPIEAKIVTYSYSILLYIIYSKKLKRIKRK